ncbi:MAG: NAD-dependent epimerase [Deltaproteobacteria bacterium]|jgi:UDP-glucuronate 4-epimerase|nr:NAD-dependent epimerase [Deltaproteobacteria bacterium]
MHVLVTGAAGFIGFHLCGKLLELGHTVVGLDSLNDYYSPQLKADRLQQLIGRPGFEFVRQDLVAADALQALFAREKFTHVVNLAAQAGVRYSLENPSAYVQANLVGFVNLLEACRQHPVKHLVFASSSSVYGLNSRLPFSEHQGVDHPVSLYAASKKSNEVIAHAYSHLFQLPCTGLRFFTVYGPWGRPDMALFGFTQRILAGEPIDIYNNGKMLRDFTYIDDIVNGVVACLLSPATANPDWDSAAPDPASSSAPYHIYNIGNNHPEELEHFIAVLEKTLNKKAIRNLLPMQPGDVPATFANIDDLRALAGFTPKTGIEEGIPRFVEWYRQYYKE